MKLIGPFPGTVTRSITAINRDRCRGRLLTDQLVGGLRTEREFVWGCNRHMNKLAEISSMMKRLNKWRELDCKIGLREWDYKEE